MGMHPAKLHKIRNPNDSERAMSLSHDASVDCHQGVGRKGFDRCHVGCFSPICHSLEPLPGG